MKLETLGVIIRFVLFLLGAAVAAFVTYRAFGSPGPYAWAWGWGP